MIKNKDEFDKNDDEFNKWDIILAYLLIFLIIVGLLISGIVLIDMTS